MSIEKQAITWAFIAMITIIILSLIQNWIDKKRQEKEKEKKDKINLIINKLDGTKTIDIDTYEQPCPICKEIMSYEYNMFNLNDYCDNPKCKAYLKRHGPKNRDLSGNIIIDE